MKEGLTIWDINHDEIFISHPFLFLGAADGPGMTYLNGLTGHLVMNRGALCAPKDAFPLIFAFTKL